MESIRQLEHKARYLGELYQKGRGWLFQGSEANLFELYEDINQVLLCLRPEQRLVLLREYFSYTKENTSLRTPRDAHWQKMKNIALRAFFRCLTA